MRNILKVLSIILTISMFSILFLTACKKDEEKQIEPVSKESEIQDTSSSTVSVEPISPYKEYENKYDEESAFAKVEEATGLKSENLLSEEEAKSLYNLVDIDIASIKVRSNIKDATTLGDGAEVAIIKLKDTNSNISALTAISKRITKVIGSEKTKNEQYVITPNDGVIVVVINKDARNISNVITAEFYE